MKYALLLIVIAGCGAQQKRAKSPAPNYANRVAQCKKDIAPLNSVIETENRRKSELIRAAETRVITAKEMSDLLDEDFDIFLAFPRFYCDAQGNEVGMGSETFNEEDLHRRFLDLLYQQARLKAIPAYNKH